MFWTGVAAIVKLLTRGTPRTSESNTSNAVSEEEVQETSSIQREDSSTTSELSLTAWSSVDSLITGSSFSEAMSDCVTADQQQREEQIAMTPNRRDSPVSNELIRTGQWIQDNRGELVSPQTAAFWPNSNQTAAQVTPTRGGCSRSPQDDDSPAKNDTAVVLENMTYVGGMNYARYRLEASRAKSAGKQKKTRPPALRVQEELARYSASTYRDGTTSSTSSRRSSAYRAVEEAAAARTAMLKAEAEAQRALARLADTRAECNEQHQSITAELEAMQSSVKDSLRAATHQTTVQAAKVDALGYRLRMEVQMAELNNQMHTLSAASHMAAPADKQPKAAEPIASTSKTVPMRTPNPAIMLKTSPKSEPKVSKPPPTGTNPVSSVQLPPAQTFNSTQNRAVDPMTTTSSTADLTDTKAMAGSHDSSAEDEVCTTARSGIAGITPMFLTASEGVPTGDPCASSTRKKDDVNGELSMQATRGSRDNSPTPNEEGEVVFQEQLRFTAAISKAMSKELAPLLTGRDQTQARPSVYRGSKEGSIDGWILVMRRYLQRTQAKATPNDKAWSIIGHLEGEARNYIINKAESERDTPEKVFDLLASRFGTGGNRMQVRQAFATRQQSDREDWMQYLVALEGLRSQGFPDEPVTTKRYEILQRFIEGVRDPALRRELSIIYASESTVAEPPTVESLRFTTRQLQRTRPRSAPYDPRYAMRSRPHPFAPLPPNKMVLPQGVMPPHQRAMPRQIKQQHSLQRVYP